MQMEALDVEFQSVPEKTMIYLLRLLFKYFAFPEPNGANSRKQ